LLKTIEGTADGCRELLYQWEKLRNLIRRGYSWEPEQEMHAIRLSGGGARPISDPAVLDLVVANRMLESPEVLIDSNVRLDGPLGLTFSQGAARDACQRRPVDPDQARTALVATIDRQMTRLHRVLVVREEDGDLGAELIAEAADLAGFDTSREAEQLRKYQFTMQRQFVKAVETIPKIRLQDMTLAEKRAKFGEKRANEPNFSPDSHQEGDGDCPDFPSPEPSPIEKRANEANFTPENGASEANFEPEIQVAFAPVRECSVESKAPVTATEANRAERRRRKALLRRLGKA